VLVIIRIDLIPRQIKCNIFVALFSHSFGINSFYSLLEQQKAIKEAQFEKPISKGSICLKRRCIGRDNNMIISLQKAGISNYFPLLLMRNPGGHAWFPIFLVFQKTTVDGPFFDFLAQSDVLFVPGIIAFSYIFP
jgi:hypothetical protein